MRIPASFGPLAASLLLSTLALTALVSFPAAAQEDDGSRGCATMVIAQRQAQQGASGLSLRVQAANLSGRTLITEHFALHYTLAPNVHRVRLTAQDAALKAAVDSILASLPGNLSAYKRDSTLHARLDSANAGHPAYATAAAQYFERAWDYYDSLGMEMPAYPSASVLYLLPAQGRYVVDIADVNAASGLSGPYYGLSYEPPGRGSGSILMENDFLYSASYSPDSDQVTGAPLRATYPTSTVVYRDYSVDWDLGLKVTASHEFYHALQYSYTPALTNVHAWYELSATGMEERLAPEVNDYFQYLRSNIPNHHSASGSLWASQTNANYGNAIFHIFLTHKLGAGFDVPIWEALGTDNNLSTALVQGIGSQARWDSLYAAYAAAMVLSGSPAAAGSALAFSPDMPLWPRPPLDAVPSSGTALLTMPAGTYRLVKPPGTGAGKVTYAGHAGSWRVDSAGGGYQALFFPGKAAVISKGAAGTATTLAVANGSSIQSRQVVLSKDTAATFSALPNPVGRAQGSVFFLVSADTTSDSLRVVSESGRRVATLPADASGNFWSWNLRDPQNRIVPPGLYFFARPGQAAKTLLVLP